MKKKTIKLTSNVKITEAVETLIDEVGVKSLLKMIGMFCLQKTEPPYSLLLKMKNSKETIEAAAAISYLIHNWDESTKKGHEIIKQIKQRVYR